MVVLSKRDAEMQQALSKKEARKEHTETAPREVITTEEGALIQNFEVDFGPQEELVMAGGLRGIKALRVQREAIEEQISTARPNEAEEQKN